MMKNETTLSHVHSGDHLGDSKMSTKDTHIAEFKSLTPKTIFTKLGTLVHDAYG